MSTSLGHKINRLIRHPADLKRVVKWHTWDRVSSYLERRRVDRSIRMLQSKTVAEYDEIRLNALSDLAKVAKSEIAGYVQELRQDRAFLDAFEQKRKEIEMIDAESTTSMIDIETLYCALRALKPQTVVETGVYFGGTSAFLLRALERNGAGHLSSIDYLLPNVQPFGHPQGQGCLVPESLRQYWTLINGDSRVELPRLLAQLGSIEFFLHDSLHTYKHMTWEYHTAWAALGRGGVLSTHDISLTDAFQDFSRKRQAEASATDIVCDVGLVRKR
jgi:Methyltransferase domain